MILKSVQQKIKSYFLKKESYKKESQKLADFLENKWFPTYKTWSKCWANVWEALIDFWVSWIPKTWRDWYKWTEILDKNENFIKIIIDNPDNAFPWWIIVYDKWYSKNELRRDYWHVEIKTNNWFWSWWKQYTKAGLNIKSGFIGSVYYMKAK